MFVYCLAWIIILFIGFLWLETKAKEGKGWTSSAFLTLFVFCFLLMLFFGISCTYKGRSINFLEEGAIYTVHSQTDIDEYSYLILEKERDKKPKFYKIVYWKLRDKNSENIISTMPERFEIERGTVTYWRGTKTSRVYFIIPKKFPKSNLSSNY